jgi:uncharacterized protein (TIGR00266 family)
MSDPGLWYVAMGGQQQGPLQTAQVLQLLAAQKLDRTAHVYGQGMTSWVPIGSIPTFAQALAPAGFPQPPPPPPPMPSVHEIDYEIHGAEMQYVEITLDPQEAAVAEAGAMMYMEPGIEVKTVFGDGSAQSEQAGFFGKLVEAGKRALTGESLFMTVFGNTAPQRRKVAFAAPYPGKIIALDLRQLGGTMLCQKDAFLCAAKGISVGVAFTKKLGAGFFGGEGFILQKLEGPGVVFVHAGGTLMERNLAPGEVLRYDTGCLVAFQPSVQYDIQMVSGIKSAFFGGEGLFYATLTGPGRVWLQSMPFSRLCGRILAEGIKRGWGGGSDQSSVLGALVTE